jgi:hypothetical protein
MVVAFAGKVIPERENEHPSLWILTLRRESLSCGNLPPDRKKWLCPME